MKGRKSSIRTDNFNGMDILIQSPTFPLVTSKQFFFVFANSNSLSPFLFLGILIPQIFSRELSRTSI